MNLFIRKLCRNLALCDFDCKPLGNGGLSDARLTYETGVVFASAAKDLNCSVNLVISADYAVYFALSCTLSEVCAVKGKKFSLFIVFCAFFFWIFAFFILRIVFACSFGFCNGIFFCRVFFAHHPLKERERGYSARLKALAVVTHAHHGAELLAHFVHVVLCDAHILHHLFYGACGLHGAFEAQALGIRLLVSVHFSHKYNRRAHFALAA